MDLQQLVKHHFSSFEPGLAAEIAQLGTIREFPVGETLISTGQYLRFIPLVFEGRLKIFREDDQGNELFLYYLVPGEACAISLVCSDREKISKIKAIADEDTRAIMVDIRMMDVWMRQYKSWYYFVLDTLGTRFDELLHTLDSVAFLSMDERLYQYLRDAVRVQQNNTIHATHQSIAEELNTSREVISRLLKKMEQRRQIILHRNHITLLSD